MLTNDKDFRKSRRKGKHIHCLTDICQTSLGIESTEEPQKLRSSAILQLNTQKSGRERTFSAFCKLGRSGAVGKGKLAIVSMFMLFICKTTPSERVSMSVNHIRSLARTTHYQLASSVSPARQTLGSPSHKPLKSKAYHKAHRDFSSLDATCDVLKLLSVVCFYEYETKQAQFCERNFVRLKGLQETHKLRQQITNIVRANCPGVIGPFEAKILPPSALQIKAIKQIVAVGFIDQIAIRADLVPNSTFKLGQSNLKKVTDVPYMTLFASSTTHKSESDGLQDVAVYVHPTSVLASQSSYPEYLVYSELKKSMSATGKVRMRPLTPVTGLHLSNLAKGTPLITYSKPLDHVPPKVLPDSSGNRRECWVIPTIGGAIGKSELGWPLPAQKVVQKKEGGKWVRE